MLAVHYCISNWCFFQLMEGCVGLTEVMYFFYEVDSSNFLFPIFYSAKLRTHITCSKLWCCYGSHDLILTLFSFNYIQHEALQSLVLEKRKIFRPNSIILMTTLKIKINMCKARSRRFLRPHEIRHYELHPPLLRFFVPSLRLSSLIKITARFRSAAHDISFKATFNCTVFKGYLCDKGSENLIDFPYEQLKRCLCVVTKHGYGLNLYMGKIFKNLTISFTLTSCWFGRWKKHVDSN